MKELLYQTDQISLDFANLTKLKLRRILITQFKLIQGSLRS